MQGEQRLCRSPGWWLFGLRHVWPAPCTSSAACHLCCPDLSTLRCRNGPGEQQPGGRQSLEWIHPSPLSRAPWGACGGSPQWHLWVLNRSLPPVSPFISSCPKGFTSWILCNHLPAPAPILGAQVTGGLQEPFETKEQHLKGHGRSPRGPACSRSGCKMCCLKAKPDICWARRGIRVLGE